MTVRDDATNRQIQAANPGQSTWLSANAGSGKTRVLTDRVARLLLGGTLPQHILCLTYTIAAANEMQNRLFQRLGRWTMLPDDELRRELSELGALTSIDDDELAHARTLFARAIETPGGLKIQTIHSFCASILRQFPLEAGISPQFTEIEERAATVLQNEVIEEIANIDGAASIDGILQYIAADNLTDLINDILKNQNRFEAGKSLDDFKSDFDLSADANLNRLAGAVLTDARLDMLRDLVPILAVSEKAADQRGADSLPFLFSLNNKSAALPLLETIFLSGKRDGFKRGFPSKDLFNSLSFKENLQAFREDLLNTYPTRIAIEAAARSHALHTFAQDFLKTYRQRKSVLGVLDFDDLINKTEALLSDPARAAWVLYRLDGGIDHILVDEAQDTSPKQWRVIGLLSQEFTSGVGAREDVERTIFVVGDKKQSIYSFQGADPREFDQMRDGFSTRLTDIGQNLQSLSLDYSFRSSPAILGVVDRVFEGQHGLGDQSFHLAFKDHLPGRVDIWPPVISPPDGDPQHWTDPVDRPAQNDAAVVLGYQIAQQIKQMIESKTPLPQQDRDGSIWTRPVHAGDFLILVQGRKTPIFHEIHRACRAADLPIAGADRMKVAAEIAVKDIRALLSFLALAEDDLSLAEALRSPIFGWSERDLYDLAQGREKKFLWEELRSREIEFPQTMTVLQELRRRADYMRPYDLIEHMLTRFEGRKNLLARLGAEASEGIDALLAQAMAFEQSATPDLTGIIGWLDADDLEIKRQMGGMSDQIRVMTVHGAKGLEAPIVILPDTAVKRPRSNNQIIKIGETAHWPGSTTERPAQLEELIEERKSRLAQEKDRLLYVALTRAENWLIVAAAGDTEKPCWYRQIANAMPETVTISTPIGEIQRFEPINWTGTARDAEIIPAVAAAPRPDFFDFDPPPIQPINDPLSPSDLGGAKALPSELGADWSEAAALEHGTAVHLLLEHLPNLPTTEWETRAKDILANTSHEVFNAALSEAKFVLRAPELTHIFSAKTLAEVPVTANIAALGGQRISGIIDRLIITDEQVLAVDFKTNKAVPSSAEKTPLGILRQMGAYASALSQIFPNHEIKCAILWTRTATLSHLPHHLVISSLETAT